MLERGFMFLSLVLTLGVRSGFAQDVSGAPGSERACRLMQISDYDSRIELRNQRVLRQSLQLDAVTRSRVARLVAPESGPLKSWCTDSGAARALEYWKRLEQELKPLLSGGRARYPSAFATMMLACGGNPIALRNAAFAIDWMYWNRQADTLGMEVADALDLRDEFYEGWVTSFARELALSQTARISVEQAGVPVPSQDFLSAGPMSEANFLKVIGLALNLADRNGREAVQLVAEALDLRDGSVVIYGRDLLEMLESEEDLTFLARLSAEISDWSGKGRRRLGEAHGGWRTLIELAQGDQSRVIRVLGVLASMRYWPLEEVGSALAARGALTCAKLRALEQGAMAYFRLNALDERAALTASDQRSLVYHYFYPGEYTTRDWKIYHWFGNGHLGCKLALRGAGAGVIEYGAKSLARAYEFATLNLGGPSRRAMGLDPRVRPILEGWADIDINTEGAVYGGRICRKSQEMR